MFSTFPKYPRMRFAGLLAGFALAAAVPVNAQTLADVQDLMKQGNLARALEQADLFIADQPRDAQGPFTKGLILTDMGRTAEAIDVFTALTENFPELPEPYNNLAVLHAGQKQYDLARVALEMAIRVDPDYAVAHENLGDIYAKLASRSYARALQLDASGTTASAKLKLAEELVGLRAEPGK
jgi:tetratricopeptide (TPR) repeat protein